MWTQIIFDLIGRIEKWALIKHRSRTSRPIAGRSSQKYLIFSTIIKWEIENFLNWMNQTMDLRHRIFSPLTTSTSWGCQIKMTQNYQPIYFILVLFISCLSTVSHGWFDNIFVSFWWYHIDMEVGHATHWSISIVLYNNKPRDNFSSSVLLLPQFFSGFHSILLNRHFGF